MRTCVARPTGFTGNVSLVGDDDEMALRFQIHVAFVVVRLIVHLALPEP